MVTILTNDMPSWPIEDYNEVRDGGKAWVKLDVLLIMALQDTIDRSPRGNRLDPLLLELLLNRLSAHRFAAWCPGSPPLDDTLLHPLRELTRLMLRLSAHALGPFRIVGLVARFPFVEPAF